MLIIGQKKGRRVTFIRNAFLSGAAARGINPLDIVFCKPISFKNGGYTDAGVIVVRKDFDTRIFGASFKFELLDTRSVSNKEEIRKKNSEREEEFFRRFNNE